MRRTLSFDSGWLRKFRLLLALPALLAAGGAQAWGDVGHEVVAGIALHYLTPEVRQRVETLLAADTDPLTAHDPVTVAVWADRYRDSPVNGPHVNYRETHEWHFVDLDRRHPSLERACHGHTPLPPGTPAAHGQPNACVVDKVEQFGNELRQWRATGKDPTEARLALKFLIHLVGDLHQPLHAIDDHDRGGNEKRIRGAGIHAGSLHHAWDTTFVELIASARLHPKGADADAAAARITALLIARITPANIKAWQRGTPREWAEESYHTAQTAGYDPLPQPDASGRYFLSGEYIREATETVAIQLEEAGVRLAWLLNTDLH